MRMSEIVPFWTVSEWTIERGIYDEQQV
jgi:hypothetical protein